MSIIAVSVVLAVWTGFITCVSGCLYLNTSPLQPLLLTEALPDTGMQAVASGQFWRLLTPIFIHFSLLHIAFNMLWMWQLGGPFERRLGHVELLLFVVIVGVLSNIAQYNFNPDAPFGGMSGVVYALLGYFWMQGRFNPRFGMALHKPIVIMMLIWFVVCWAGLVGNIANMAHTAGLSIGVLWGFISARVPHP